MNMTILTQRLVGLLIGVRGTLERGGALPRLLLLGVVFLAFLTGMMRRKDYSPKRRSVVTTPAIQGEYMISRLHGEVVEIDGDSIVLDVNGVGYEAACTSALLSRLSLGSRAIVSVYTDVREDAIRLFGFDSAAERHIFLLLNRVSGMGPRSSLDVVSNVAIRDLLRAIGSGDVRALMSIKGVGKKKAERIVVELKDLVAAMAGERADSLRSMVAVERASATSPSSVSSDAVSALEVLGFARRDAESAVAQAVQGQGGVGEVGDLIREALRYV